MSGPTPLTVDYRLTFKYTVLGLQHKHTTFLDAVASTDATGFDAVARSGGTNVGVSGLADYWFAILAPFYRTADASFDGYVFENRSGTDWIFVYADGTTVTPSGSGASQKAFQYGLFGKFLDNSRCNRYIYEVVLSGPNRYTNFSGLASADQGLTDYYFNNTGSTWNDNSGYNWIQSRGGSYIQRWISNVTDTNEKLRRLRSIK